MRGFILLEVLVSIMISSMIFMTLMGAIFQLSKTRVTADDAIEVYTRVSTIMSLMEQDFGGATIPVQADLPKNEKQNAQPEQKRKEAKEDQKKEENSEAQNLGKQEKIKPIKHIFYSTTKDKNSNLITCITNNPTTIYWSESAGKAKPRIARVLYVLTPDKEHKESFLLKRQEGLELDFTAYINAEKPAARAYEIAQGIKEFSITYLYIEKKEEQQPSSISLNTKNAPKEASPKKEAVTKKEPPQKPDYKSQNDWGLEEKEGGEKKSKQPLMPHYMLVHLVLWNSTYKKDYTFDFAIELCANEKQQIKQAQMRYEKEKNKSGTNAQKLGASSASQPVTKTIPEIPSNATPTQELDLMAYRTQPSRIENAPKNDPDSKSKDPIIVASENHISKNFEEKLAENIMQGFMQEMHDQALKESQDDDQQENSYQKKIDSDDQTDQEYSDMPAGRIDVIRDGDKAYVVYQGPIALTQEMIEEALS